MCFLALVPGAEVVEPGLADPAHGIVGRQRVDLAQGVLERALRGQAGRLVRVQRDGGDD